MEVLFVVSPFNKREIDENRFLQIFFVRPVDFFFFANLLILFKYRISILIRYRYDTFGQKYRNFDTDTIVSKVSALNAVQRGQ